MQTRSVNMLIIMVGVFHNCSFQLPVGLNLGSDDLTAPAAESNLSSWWKLVAFALPSLHAISCGRNAIMLRLGAIRTFFSPMIPN